MCYYVVWGGFEVVWVVWGVSTVPQVNTSNHPEFLAQSKTDTDIECLIL